MNEPMATEMAINEEADIVQVRRCAREAAQRTGFGPTDVTRIVTACSEMARNIFKYAGRGTMRWRSIAEPDRVGLELVFQDQGPGIADINLAMQEATPPAVGWEWGFPEQNGWSTSSRLNRGLAKAPPSR